MDTWLKQSLFAAAVTVGVTVGLVWYEKRAMAQASAGSTSSVMGVQQLSLSGQKQVQVTLPAGGSLTASASLNPAIATVSGSTITAVGVGSTIVTVSWLDGGGTPQKTTVPVTVKA